MKIAAMIIFFEGQAAEEFFYFDSGKSNRIRLLTVPKGVCRRYLFLAPHSVLNFARVLARRPLQ